MGASIRQTEQNQARFNIRASARQKEVIAQAAQLRQTTISDFILESAYEAAIQALADNTQIVMSPEQFEVFCAALDAPPPSNMAALRKLLTEPSILDGK